MPGVFFKKQKPNGEATLRDLPRCLAVFMTFAAVFMIFRANGLYHLAEVCSTLVHGSWTEVPMGITGFYFIVPLAVVDWQGRHQEFPLERMAMPTWARWTVYWTLLALIAFYSTGHQVSYIYFQF